MKTCTKCGVTKSLDDFYFRKNNTLHNRDAQCKTCVTAANVAHYHNDAEYRETKRKREHENYILYGKATLSRRIHKQCEKWRDWMLAHKTPSSDLHWRGVMELMFFVRDNPNQTRKLKEWFKRVETAMIKLGYAE